MPDSKINSEQFACCGKGTCHGIQSTVGSATTETRTLRELGVHTFILRTLLFFYVQLFDVNCKSSRCKSYYNERSILLLLYGSVSQGLGTTKLRNLIG